MLDQYCWTNHVDVIYLFVCVPYTYLLVTVFIWLNAVTLFTLVIKINVVTIQT